MNFLPKNYKEPVINNYMKFKEGNNTFRVLSSAITGFEWWVDDKEGNRKPVRSKTDDEMPEDAKHFWAFVVYNLNDERIQILEITQVGIRKAITALINNEKWGDPKEYNIVITRTGEGFETEYQVTPEPKEKLDKDILDKYGNMNVNLDALYEGDDPFKEKDEVDIDEAIKEIG